MPNARCTLWEFPWSDTREAGNESTVAKKTQSLWGRPTSLALSALLVAAVPGRTADAQQASAEALLPVHVIPMLTVTNASARRDSNNGYGFEVVMSEPISGNLRAEGGLFLDRFAGDGGPDWDSRGVVLNLVRTMGTRDLPVDPFVLGSLMVVQSEAGSDSATGPAVRFGFGFQSPLGNSGLELRSEIGFRQIITSGGQIESDFGEFQLRLGVTVPTKFEGIFRESGTPSAMPLSASRRWDSPELVFVYFPFDSESLSAEDRRQLDRIADTVQRDSTGRHTFMVTVLAGAPRPDMNTQATAELNRRRLDVIDRYLQSRGLWAPTILRPDMPDEPRGEGGLAPAVQLRVLGWRGGQP